ncbi:hypothetical protein [Pedobacter hartonius]|uniref:1-acyl-sn-glycerol-3-phosphate acyltransferase n=1 Tax=Pedobacter hartonius TaxID=425514 RepID=A0A1H4BJ14_9SPHI|nr:hypothetical protein [Pedobacter hartonius]SEA48110.1 hypothetical protein SAMN05443550_103368 [Pedobacter hartonius]
MRLLYYYLQIILPIPLLLIFLQLGLTWVFGAGLLLYVCIYRPFITGYRLLAMGLIRREDFSKLFIPLYSTRYFYDLHFKP